MKIFYTAILFLVLIITYPELRAQSGLNVAPAPVLNGRYQQVDLDPYTPCSCDEKTPRHQELNAGVQESDIRTYHMFAYKIAISSPAQGISKLFKALEEDPAVMKISIREWDYVMVFTTPDFDKVSFDTAARKVFAEFYEITPAEYFLYKNASLHKLFQQIYPQGYTLPSSTN